MNCEQARENLVEGLAGPLDGPVEEALEAHLASCDACSEEAAGLTETWRALAALDEQEVPSDRMRVRFRAALGAYEAGAGTSWRRRLAGLGRRLGSFGALPSPAAAALLLAGIALGWIGSGLFGPGREISDLSARMDTMSHAVTLALLEHQSASERLRGVSWSAGLQPDDQVLGALVEAAERDPSVNVRLAAVEALGAHLERPLVRSGLVRSLERRPEPYVQMAVTRLFAAEEEGSDELERLLDSDLLDPEVRRALFGEEGV